MIWLYLILTYNVLFLFVYFIVIIWLGGAKFSFTEMFIDWIVSPYLFYVVIKYFSVAIYYIIQSWFKHFKYIFTHRHTKRIYDPYLNKMITISK